MAQGTSTGVPVNVSTNPRSVSVGGTPFTDPIGNDEWDLITKAWAATPKKEITVTWEDNPLPKKIIKVSGA